MTGDASLCLLLRKAMLHNYATKGRLCYFGKFDWTAFEAYFELQFLTDL